MARWVEFVELAPNPKTKVWDVVSKSGGESLGSVSWFGRWRKYAFFPNDETIYEPDCLRDIAQFCEDETLKHRGQEPASETILATPPLHSRFTVPEGSPGFHRTWERRVDGWHVVIAYLVDGESMATETNVDDATMALNFLHAAGLNRDTALAVWSEHLRG